MSRFHSMAGGYEVFGKDDYIEKTFTNLGVHSALRIRGTFFKIDYWSGSQGQLLVDGGVSWESQRFTFTDPPCCGVDACGNTGWRNGDTTQNFDAIVAHYADDVTLRFTTTLVQNGDYWGVNGIRIETRLDHPSPPAPPALPGIWSNVLYERWPGATGWTSNQTLDGSAVTTCGGELGR
jgi:hypothetical protein